MTHLPFPNQPSNENHPRTDATKLGVKEEVPWEPLRAIDPPQPMFTIHFYDGRSVTLAYADLRETVLRDPGHLKLLVYGFEKQVVVIEGRHLRPLQQLIGMHRVKSLVENGPRSFTRPEGLATIEKITIEVC